MERLIKAGKLKAKSALDIQDSRLGIGFEKLDRNVFDPEKAYDKISSIGVKWVRLQTGWQRTEREKGVYDFSWLDDITNNLLRRGMKPWFNICYGNELYDELAAEVFGAVGCPPIHTEEQKTAWKNYITALVTHFCDRVKKYEIWNEPDGKWCWKHGVSGTEFGIFTNDTAKAIKSLDGSLEVIGGVICKRPIAFLNEAFEAGLGENLDAISFHEYTPKEINVFERVRVLSALAHKYNPNIRVIQGESGSQSRSGGNGALKIGAWTERKQAKQLLRHTVADLFTDVEFTSYFSSVDMIEALNGVVGDKSSYLDYGYFGVLRADFDENGFSTGSYSEKPSYYALQNLAALFSDGCEMADIPLIFLPEGSPRLILGGDLKCPDLISGGFVKPNGSAAFAYWYPAELMTTEYEGTVTFQFAAMGNDFALVDTMDGSVYKIPDFMIETDGHGAYKVLHLPVKDYPLVLTFGNFAEIE